ncbi:hypothetical protein BJ742DRAFT_839465 [Cladochytrium replicatum]|nr:hypothetical protein BJ742DRAFT_839465 [Cladochytrium replicatum]
MDPEEVDARDGMDWAVEGTPAASMDTHIPESNAGYKLMLKMGWVKGSGLGRLAQGRVDPIRIDLKIDTLGLGRSEMYDQWHAESTAKAKSLTSELIAQESEERRLLRESQVSKKESVKEELKATLAAFYCALCDKQYKKVAEYESHLSSYDHHHKKRFMEMQQAHRAGPSKRKRDKEKEREEKELERLRAAAMEQEMRRKGTMVEKEAIGVEKPMEGDADACKPQTEDSSTGGGWESIGRDDTKSQSSGGWMTVGTPDENSHGSSVIEAVENTAQGSSSGAWKKIETPDSQILRGLAGGWQPVVPESSAKWKPVGSEPSMSTSTALSATPSSMSTSTALSETPSSMSTSTALSATPSSGWKPLDASEPPPAPASRFQKSSVTFELSKSSSATVVDSHGHAIRSSFSEVVEPAENAEQTENATSSSGSVGGSEMKRLGTGAAKVSMSFSSGRGGSSRGKFFGSKK